ncbi:hypothetical protein MMC14_005478 [Varicellaria rhodocarpa]|nr:hypothetical protein [Varicellaria rhodocarpa]
MADIDGQRATTAQFEQALDSLALASRQSAKLRIHNVSELINIILAYGKLHGIPALALSSLFNVITGSNHLDQVSVTTLIKGLYPATEVSPSLLCTVVNSLGQGKQKPSSATQNQLLRWIILVMDVLENGSILEKLYSVLFNLIDMITIRANLCHVLALLTRRKHVKPYRIQILLELSRNIGNDPALLGLLGVFKEYYPDVILGQTRGKIARFEHPDLEWQERLRIIQGSNLKPFEKTQVQSTSFKVTRRSLKYGQSDILPEVHTYRADESSTTLEQINGLDDFVENLENIELPNQLVSILDDPLLQDYLLLMANKFPQSRVDHWLGLFFDAQLESIIENGKQSKALIEMLQKAQRYARRTKALPTSIESFIIAYLPHWNGVETRPLILGLLEYLSLESFADLQTRMFNPLEHAILDSTSPSAATILAFYTSLLRHWTTKLLAQVLPSSTSPSTIPPPPSSSTTLQSLTNHASVLALTLLTSDSPTQSTISTVLDYHEALAHTISYAPIHPQIYILTPVPETIYLLLFLSPSLSSISRLCSLLATYKRTFEMYMARPPQTSVPELYPKDYVNHFNGFLMDICNLLWRSRAFNTTDTNALGCLLPPSLHASLKFYLASLTPPHSLPTIFSLSLNPVLCRASIAAFRELEDKAISEEGDAIQIRHAGPVSQRSLQALVGDGGLEVGWGDYRLEVLRWLRRRGVGGVGELMGCTMKHLMGNGI